MLTREQIQRADDKRLEPVPCPEWGGSLYVRNLSGEELSLWHDEMDKRKTGKQRRLASSRGLKGRLIVLAACDAEGRQVFSAEDADWLETKNAAVLNRLWEAACKLSGLGEDEQEQIAKNSDAAPS